jgi:ABC-type Fe3+ transport system permease subunit
MRQGFHCLAHAQYTRKRRRSFSIWRIAVAFFLIVHPHLIAILVSIVRIDGKDVAAKTPAVAVFNGAAPKAVRLAIAAGFYAPLNPVAVVLFAAVKATDKG